MKELENIISELVSMNRRLANNFKTEEGIELRSDLFDITQRLERYKQDQALQLQQTGVSGSFDLYYWSERCKLAEMCNEASPCDPDITNNQIECWNEYYKFIDINGKKNYR